VNNDFRENSTIFGFLQDLVVKDLAVPVKGAA
jgi:methylenetetrahydrofolate reductase (NADPH)